MFGIDTQHSLRILTQVGIVLIYRVRQYMPFSDPSRSRSWGRGVLRRTATAPQVQGGGENPNSVPPSTCKPHFEHFNRLPCSQEHLCRRRRGIMDPRRQQQQYTVQQGTGESGKRSELSASSSRFINLIAAGGAAAAAGPPPRRAACGAMFPLRRHSCAWVLMKNAWH